MEPVTVIGAGLAGSECALQLARRGIPVRLCEMKPLRRSPAHQTDGPAELVCSNCLRSDNPESAIGMLHAELRRLGSVILGEADLARVPAGEALAVDRERFSAGVERALASAPGLERAVGEVESLPTGVVVVATGPLTSEALTRALSGWTGDKLYFYDSIAPIVSADSIDEAVAFRASRYGKGDGADYLNLPLDEAQYRAFVAALLSAEKVVPHAFEEPRYFEGCLPIEVMAERGVETLAYGPMKPVGLEDPRTGRRPYAVVQLRQEDLAGTAFNLVGFQTRLTWPEQRRIFRTAAGARAGRVPAHGADPPEHLHRRAKAAGRRTCRSGRSRGCSSPGRSPGSRATSSRPPAGYLVGAGGARRGWPGRPFVPPPAETALGALYRHVTGRGAPSRGTSTSPRT